jgi:hypothetical protein
MADGNPSESAPPPEGGRGSSELDRGGQFSERFLAWIGRTIRRFIAWTKRFARESVRAWKYLDGDQRVAAVGAMLLVVSTFGSFTFVEAAVALVGLAILLLLKKRADGRMFHLPFGDGLIIMVGGAWSAVLILIRLFDRPLGQNLLALVCCAIIIVAGLRIRVRRPIDDLPEARAAAAAGVEFVPPEPSRPAPSDTPSGVRRRRSRTQSIPAGQMALDQIPPPDEGTSATRQLSRPDETSATQALPRPETEWPDPTPPARARPAAPRPAEPPTPPAPPPPPPPPRDETAATRSLAPRPPERDETAVRPQPTTPAGRRASRRPDPLDLPPPRTPAPPSADDDADPDFDFDPTPPPRPPAREDSGPFRARRADPPPDRE